MKNLNHPNILQIYEYYDNEDDLIIFSELCTGGELFDEISNLGNFSEKKAAKIFEQVIIAVQYCHEKNVVHRDLKPENILFDDSDKELIKVVDFGTSIMIKKGEKLSKSIGTPYYIAPEIL